jgi:putative SOS response-associated peptidase YedK
MEKIHNKKKRMPVILPDELASQWIRSDISVNEISLLAKYQLKDEYMTAHTIRKDFRQLEEPREKFLYEELPTL